MKRTIICAAICVITASLSSFGDLLHPDVLLMPDGTRITSAKEWSLKARPQILDFFEKNVYGKIPPRPTNGSPYAVRTRAEVNRSRSCRIFAGRRGLSRN